MTFAAGNSLHESDRADDVSLEGLVAGEQAAAHTLTERRAPTVAAVPR